MMTVEEALTHLGEPVTGELRDFAEATSRGFLWKSKLKGRVRTYTCSLCGMQWDYDDREPADVYQADCFQWNLKQWTRVSCPNCERSLYVYEEWRGAGKLGYKRHFAEQWRRSAADPNVIIAVGASASRYYLEPGAVEPDATIQVISMVVYRYGRAGERFVRGGDGVFRRMTRVNHLDAGLVFTDRHIDWESVRRAAAGTPFERVLYPGLENGFSPVVNMSWLSTHPAAEYMIKLGFGRLVTQRFEYSYIDAVINWRGKTMEDVFGLDKGTVRALRAYGDRLGYSSLEAFKELRKCVSWPAPRLIETVFELNISAHGARGLTDEAKARGYCVQNELKYMLAQSRGRRPVLPSDLVDFWRQCDRLQVPADDYRARHPAEFHEMHREAGDRIRYQADAALDQMIAGRLADYEERLGFAGCGLILRPAESTSEVIREGSKLHHCVGGYCRQYARGNTVILVLRREEDPDRPWHTVEMTPDGLLIQCRGAYNQTGEADRPLIDAFWAAYRAAKHKDNAKTA